MPISPHPFVGATIERTAVVVVKGVENRVEAIVERIRVVELDRASGAVVNGGRGGTDANTDTATINDVDE